MDKCYCGRFELPNCACCDSYLEDALGLLRHTAKVCFELHPYQWLPADERGIRMGIPGDIKRIIYPEGYNEDRTAVCDLGVDHADAASGD